MPRASDRRPFALVLVCLLGALSAACGGPAAEVTVVLRPGEGTELGAVGALKLIVRDVATESPEVFGPFAIGRERPTRLPALVVPGADFYLDVWGCRSVDDCDPADLAARGCSGIESVPEGSKDRVIAVEMLPPDDARAGACPPALP